MASESSTLGKKAAIYVRMSTHPQDHSIEHQCERLYSYAKDRGIEIVKMYADAGKSGLRINNRDGLRELITDVQARTADFNAVLVYDISRWGRFQDVDEGAHYEFVCRDAGIQVLYCAEPFENDGSALASMVKSMKRTMAAEYSRELSAKVFEAQRRFAAQGYKMGGSPGFGLRRMCFDRDGKERRTLSAGERKGAITDRVRFCWGPPDEVSIVRHIYSWFIEEHLTDTEIARLLNQRKVVSGTGRAWTPWLVKSILTNEKYAGRIIFNRGSAKLTGLREPNPVADWICISDSLPAIVSPAQFDLAQRERSSRSAPMNQESVLAMLRDIHDHHGKVTVALIDATPGLPNPKRIGETFGTLAEAYALAGVPDAEKLQHAKTKRSIQKMREATFAACKLLIERSGITLRDCDDRWCICMDEKIVVKLVVARARYDLKGRVRWRIPIHTAPIPDFVVCVRMDGANAGVLDYYLIPIQDFTEGHIILRGEHPADRADYRYPSLAAIFGVID
jgi:DNA invertase Pin-like site-specific DNA recombinase